MCNNTNTHSEYVIHIAFPRQKWLRERASMLRYIYIACLVFDTCIFNFLTRVLFQFQSLATTYFDTDNARKICILEINSRFWVFCIIQLQIIHGQYYD